MGGSRCCGSRLRRASPCCRSTAMPSEHRWCCDSVLQGTSPCYRIVTMLPESPHATGAPPCCGSNTVLRVCCDAHRHGMGAPPCHGSNVGAASLLRGSSPCCGCAVVPWEQRQCCGFVLRLVVVLWERRHAIGASPVLRVYSEARRHAVGASLCHRCIAGAAVDVARQVAVLRDC